MSLAGRLDFENALEAGQVGAEAMRVGELGNEADVGERGLRAEAERTLFAREQFLASRKPVVIDLLGPLIGLASSSP